MEELNERLFEAELREIITTNILPKSNSLVLMESKKAVDILICKNGDRPQLYFIEVKFHRKHHGRLGFGSGAGIGFQPEILMKNPDYFHQNMRWIIGDDDHGLDGFLLLNNKQLSAYLSGGSVGKKFNNIQKRLLREGEWINRDRLISELYEWMA